MIYNLVCPPEKIKISPTGTNKQETIQFYLDNWFEQWPDLEVTLWYQNPGQPFRHIENIEIEDNCLFWKPTYEDTNISGMGAIEIHGSDESGTYVKSPIIKVEIPKSLGEINSVSPVEQNWMQHIEEICAQAIEANASAQQALQQIQQLLENN